MTKAAGGRANKKEPTKTAGGENDDDETTAATDSIEEFIPPYLRKFINPYYGDFCYTRCFHYMLVAQVMSEGFLPIATRGAMLPKLHENRCVVKLPDNLHVGKSTRKKSKRFQISINKAFDDVVAGCKTQHGRRCWLYPPLLEAFKAMFTAKTVNVNIFEDGINATRGKICPVRLYSIEVWNSTSGDLVGGELGYTIGSVYTSLTGFSKEDSAGSVQLAALGRLLSKVGFTIWDLGMEMDYKNSLGCHNMARKEYRDYIKSVRGTHGGLMLPTTTGQQQQQQYSAKALIDQEVEFIDTNNDKPATVGPKIATTAPPEATTTTTTAAKPAAAPKHHHPPDGEDKNPKIKKKQRNKSPPIQPNKKWTDCKDGN